MRLIFTAALLSALSLAQPALAQEQRGAIEGTVQDAQRAVLAGATIAALNLAETGAVSTITGGTFRFPALTPGYYDVTASRPGFSALRFARVEVLLGQVKQLAFVLEIAGVSEDEADDYAGRADVGAAFDQQQLPRGPRFLQYEFFQEPIKARVGVRFSF